MKRDGKCFVLWDNGYDRLVANLRRGMVLFTHQHRSDKKKSHYSDPPTTVKVKDLKKLLEEVEKGNVEEDD